MIALGRKVRGNSKRLFLGQAVRREEKISKGKSDSPETKRFPGRGQGSVVSCAGVSSENGKQIMKGEALRWIGGFRVKEPPKVGGDPEELAIPRKLRSGKNICLGGRVVIRGRTKNV